MVTQAEQVPTNIPLSTPLPQSAPKGKTMVWLQCNLSQCATIGSGVAAAASAIGWNYKSIPYDSANPATLVSAMTKALQYNPVAVALSGLPPAVWSSEIPAYQKAGVPIIPSFVGPVTASSTVPADIFGPDDSQKSASAVGDWLIADSGGHGDALVLTSSAFPVFGWFTQDLRSVISSGCTGCKLTTLDATVGQIDAGQVNGLVVSALKRDPNIKYVLAADAIFIDGLPSALSAAGLANTVKVASNWGDVQAETYVKSGQEAATTGLASEYSGWLDVDVAARLLEKARLPSPSDGGLPTQLLTQSNVGTPDNSYNLPSDYPTEFKSLWHVS
jgi:ribose transport system substrate-binding protein